VRGEGSWLSLNGPWEYAVTTVDEPDGVDGLPPPGEWDGSIRVPFPVESLLSNVQKPLPLSEELDTAAEFQQANLFATHRVCLWYKRRFNLPVGAKPAASTAAAAAVGGSGGKKKSGAAAFGVRGGGSSGGGGISGNSAFGSGSFGVESDLGGSRSTLRYFLNFEAVDYEASVWVNGKRVGGHVGGFAPWRIEVSERRKRRARSRGGFCALGYQLARSALGGLALTLERALSRVSVSSRCISLSSLSLCHGTPAARTHTHFKITSAVDGLTTVASEEGTHEVVVRVVDSTDGAQPRGKQSKRPKGIW